MWRPPNKAFGMISVSGIKHGLPLEDKLSSLAIVDSGGSQQLEAGVMVPLVIPGEELLAETAAILNRTKAVRVFRAILHGFEVGFGERVVIGDVRTAVSLNDAEIGKQIAETPFYRTPEFGDVPTPELVGRGGQQFRFPVRRMNQLIAAFAILAFCVQQPIHGADGAVVLAVVE